MGEWEFEVETVIGSGGKKIVKNLMEKNQKNYYLFQLRKAIVISLLLC